MRYILILFGALTLLFGCKKSSVELLSPQKHILAESEAQLTEFINHSLKSAGQEKSVKSIDKIKYDDKHKKLTALVDFTTTDGAKSTIGIVTEFGENENEFLKTGITCKGNCTSGDKCQVSGLINSNGDIEYLECSCSGCKMNITILQNTLKPLGMETYSLNELAKRSYQEKFGTVAEIEITKYENLGDEKARVEIIEYRGGDKTSSLMLIKPKVNGITAAGQELEVGKSFEVDCTDSCDCRERWYPGTGAVECTCSPCKMKVTEIKPAP